MPATKKKEIAFKLKNIEILETQLRSPVSNQPKPSVYNFNITIEHRYNINLKAIIVVVNIQVLDDNKENTLGSVKTGCVFTLAEFDTFLNNEKTEVNLPEDLIILFNSVSISTSRGIMFAYFRGTHLHNAVLPVIDPKTFKKIQA